jgi:hypothetical protein
MPEGTVAAVRDFLVRQIRNRADKPYTVALHGLLARTFGGDPYAWDPIGSRRASSAPTERPDRARPAPSRAGWHGAAISGNVQAAAVSAEVGRLFGAMAVGPVPAATEIDATAILKPTRSGRVAP